MEIKIDTNKDSKEDIRQAIKLLQTTIGEMEKEPVKDMFSRSETPQRDEYENTTSNETTSSGGLFDIFNNDETKDDEKDNTNEALIDDTHDKTSAKEERGEEKKKVDIVPY